MPRHFQTIISGSACVQCHGHLRFRTKLHVIFSVPPEGHPYKFCRLHNSPQTHSSRAGSELCLPFNPSSPDRLIPACPGNHAHFRREIEGTVNRGCLMLKNPIKFSAFLLALLLPQITNLNFSLETYSGYRFKVCLFTGHKLSS